MQQLINFLQGKKTYILVAVGAFVWAGEALGYISHDTAMELFKLLGVGAVATLRSAISAQQ